MRTSLGIAGVLLMVLAGGVGLQFASVRDIKEGDRSRGAQPVGLAQRVPPALTGWEGRDEQLGPNEVLRSAVERNLNFDDHVFRIFRRGDFALGVYVAYWSPGRMPLQKVASHTPDRCWTENGWKCLEMRDEEKVSGGQARLRPAQWRLFGPPGSSGQAQHVLYWHLVGDRLYDYGARFNARPDLLKWWRDTVSYAATGSDAQYFVRLTCNQPFASLKGDPGWEELLGALAKLGLSADR